MTWRMTVWKPVPLLLLLCSVSVRSATYYVDYETGSDANAGTKKTSPWKRAPGMPGASGTVARAHLNPGDTVILKRGVTWPAAALPLHPMFSGESGNPITFSSVAGWGTGEHAVLDAECRAERCIDFSRYDGTFPHLVFEGLHLKDATGSGYENKQGEHHVVRNCRVTGAGGYSGLRSLCAHTLFENNVISGCLFLEGGYGLSMSYGDHSIARGNEISNCRKGLRFDNGLDHGVMERNYIHDLEPGDVRYAVTYRSSSCGTIRYNVVDIRGYGTSGTAIIAWGGNKSGLTAHTIYNNTLIGAGSGVGVADAWGAFEGWQIHNNICYRLGQGIVIGGSKTGHVLTNNLFWDCQTDIGGGASKAVSGSIHADPRFPGAALRTLADFAPCAGSPAIDAGIVFDSYHNGVNTDIGTTRVPAGRAPDVGAIESEAGRRIGPPRQLVLE